MYGYGIDAGVSDDGNCNRVIKLQGRRLLEGGGLQSLKGGVSLDGSSKNPAWSKLAREVAAELDDRGIHPVGVDCPLTLAVPGAGRGRPFENLVQAPIPTPADFESWPSGSSASRAVLARLWSQVARILVDDHGWTLWAGEQRIVGSKLLVEVFTRTTWTALAAARRVPVLKEYSRSVQLRDDVLEALGVAFPGDVRLNESLRDGAACAITAGKVATRTAGFLGTELEEHPKLPAFTGGGIAVPWLR
ncbi:MAG: hypothetical protein PVG07_11995 [Acidobacteriota bacterium]